MSLVDSPLTNSTKAGQAATEDRVFTCTLGRSKTQKVWDEPPRTFSFDELAVLVTSHTVGPKNGACLVPATLRGNRRIEDDTSQIDIAILDSDDGATLGEIENAVRSLGCAAVISSTHSHMTTQTSVSRSNWDRYFSANPDASASDFLQHEKQYLARVAADAAPVETTDQQVVIEHQPCPKFHVIVPLARPWRALDYATQKEANAAWKERIEALAAALALTHDQACVDTSRLFFLPRRPADGAAPETAIIRGNYLDIFSLPPAAPSNTSRAESGSTRTGQQQAGDRFVFTDPIQGETIDLTDWARAYGSRFLIAKALHVRSPTVFTGLIVDSKVHVDCPNGDEHTIPGRDNATFVSNASQTQGFVIHCRHAHCTGQDRLFFLRQMLQGGWLLAADLTDPRFLLSDGASEIARGTPPPVDPASSAALRHLLAVETWAERDIPEPVRLLGDLVTKTTRTFLVGRTGLGKTLFGLAMAVGIASGLGFLHWLSSRPGRVIYIDGEMPAELIKPRAQDAMRRLGVAIPAENLLIYGRDIEAEAQRVCPSLPPFASLNTDEGRLFMAALLHAIGDVDAVIFDNVMSLITGDMKDEIPWSETLPLVTWLTDRRIGQVWLDHTGHNGDRQYGSSTKAWRFDSVGVMTPLDEPSESGTTAFMLSFDHPGKARRRTPDNWQEFQPHIIRLINDEWTSEPVEVQASKQVATLRPAAVAQHRALIDALVVSPTPGRTTKAAWYAECVRLGLADAVPIEAGWKERDKKMAGFRARLAELKVAGWIGCNGETITNLKE